MVAYLPHDESELRHIAAKDRFVHAQRTLCYMRAKAAVVPKLRSNHAARSNNIAIWRPSRPLYVSMPSLWHVAHRGTADELIIVFADVIIGRCKAAQALYCRMGCFGLVSFVSLRWPHTPS
jgi:hypothetical protein